MVGGCWHEHAGEFQARGDFACAAYLAREKTGRSQLLAEIHFNLNGVAGAHQVLEAHVVHSSNNGHVLARGLMRMSQQNRSSLQRRLAQNNTWNERVIGVMSGKKPFLSGKVLATENLVLGLREYFLNQQKRWPMRNRSFDL